MKFVDVSRIRSRFDESFVTRDGIRLSADIYWPAEDRRFPVLVTRTPYDNNRTTRPPSATTLLPSPADRHKKLAAHGFIVVACDVRGRGDSDGRFSPFAHEVEDGADTIAWVRQLPESDGRVGVFGSGYAGFTALAAATEATVDAVAVSSPFETHETPFRGGALRLDWLFWMQLVGGRTPQPVDVPPWIEIFRHRPLLTLHQALGREDVPWTEWLEGAPQLHSLDLKNALSSLTAPTLFVTGWWDSELDATVRQWEAAGTSNVNPGHALLIGPWDAEAVRHPHPRVGGVDWGPTASIDPDELLIDWFAAHLKEDRRPIRAAQIFVTGRNEWMTGDVFPDVAETSTLWLSSDGSANTRRGDGRLVSSAGEHARFDCFTHDPENPVPWQPAYGSFSRSAPAKLTLDTSFATSRDDVLVYDAHPVRSSLLLCGRPVARLWVHSDAHDADWVVAIEDVFPGGSRTVHLSHGTMRAHHEQEGPLELAIELAPVAHELLPGHALRLLVASSLWPLYAVNFGGRDYLRDTVPRLSKHTVFHDAKFPSRVELPIRR